jgi:hypothetical protein
MHNSKIVMLSPNNRYVSFNHYAIFPTLPFFVCDAEIEPMAVHLARQVLCYWATSSSYIQSFNFGTIRKYYLFQL